MNNYIAVAATTNETAESWGGTSEFTDEAITQLAMTAIGKPVLIDFDRGREVGRVVSCKNAEGRLIVEFSVTEGAVIDKLLRLVPGYIVERDVFKENNRGIHRTINKAKSTDYGLTYKPCEKDLPEIAKSKQAKTVHRMWERTKTVHRLEDICQN